MKTIVKTLALVMILFTACTNNTTVEKTNKKIDSLLTQLDSAQALLNKIKADSTAAAIKKEMKETSKKLSVKLDTSEIDNKTLTKAGAYMNLYKFFKKLDNKTGEIQMNLTYTVNQLNDLKHDVPLLAESDTAKLNKYISDETKATSIVVEKSRELYDNLQKNKDKFKELKPVADSLLNN